ncbi:serine hydrolase [Kineosporia sp. A_224]|uniref:serine hydrolase domain-containing protein n=1 Tax=Kineosporia sp. A_224 TaxID=1962180 RepID=UPI000B4BA632|nr:serine hydrolase domain-containing protein [Kineosporia sp. A_224]
MEPFKAEALRDLRAYAARHVRRESLPALQLALARGPHNLTMSFGCGDTTRFCVYSISKPLFASAIWRLAGTEGFELSTSIAELVPELTSCPIGGVRLSDVMSHTGGFPNASADLTRLGDSRTRLAAIAEWELEWEPGSRYVYHAVSAHWVLAAVLSALTGEEHGDAFHRLVTTSLRLPQRVLGVTSPSDYLPPVLPTSSTPDDTASWAWLLAVGSEPVMSAGLPGAGCVMTATEVASTYQEFLRNRSGLWRPDILAQATSEVVNRFMDDYAGVSANRSVGFAIAGPRHEAAHRGFGRRNSEQAFGHGGAGGQIAWADPATGLSFACVSNGLMTDGRRIQEFECEVSDLATACL